MEWESRSYFNGEDSTFKIIISQEIFNLYLTKENLKAQDKLNIFKTEIQKQLGKVI